ncbi:AI-2E family transporter [Paenarthrobacter sp. Z7-10]|uniref:AI-2E family transporter n=1 Tax=Paenarthrobacter sp. Z7-10 TaxID=2787635 RepID=UPI0022A9E349|nr:AI-2E family transporter [Paenarthrobacter sp. Z7-10]
MTFVRLRAFQVGLIGALGVGVAVLIWGAVASLATVLAYIVIALFIALGLDPVVGWLERLRLPRPAAVVLLFAALLAVLAGIVLLVVPLIIQQARDLIESVPALVTQASETPWIRYMERLLAGYIDVNALVNNIGSFFKVPANLLALGGGLLAVGKGIASGVTGVVIVFVLTLYFVVSMRGMKRSLYQLVPASRRDKFAEVTEDISTAVSSYVMGQLSLSVLNGVLSAIVLSLVGAPVPLLLALFALVGALIPLVGTAVSATIITLISLIASPQTALIVGIYYLIYMQVEAYILTPRIMNRAVAVPGSLVVVAAVTGGTLAGILGALVAIPVAAAALIIIRKVIVPRQNLL